MRGRYQKIIIWLFSEIILTLSGCDDLADYSEFIFERDLFSNMTISEVILNLNLVNFNSFPGQQFQFFITV